MGNEGQKICGDLPETTAFKSYAAKQERRSQYANYSDLPAVSFLRLTHSEASEGYPTIVNNIQPCPKLCLPMPLAYVGARTDSTSYTATRKAWPISAHTHWRSRQDMLYLRRGFSTLVLLVLFIFLFAHKLDKLRYFVLPKHYLDILLPLSPSYTLVGESRIPLWSSSSTTSICPPSLARCSGVNPFCGGYFDIITT